MEIEYFISFIMFISAGTILWLVDKYNKHITFIRDNNLQKKWQEWKKDNKGLI